MRTMTARYAGTCKTCKREFPKGTWIRWAPGQGSEHASAKECMAAAQLPLPVAPPVAHASVTVDGTGIVALLKGAQARGKKWPKVRFATPDKKELRMSIAGAKAKVPGSVQCKVDGEWVGRIEPTGKVVGGRLLRDAALVALLQQIAKDPAAAAAAYGALMCQCSFCGKPLRDEGSTEVGYGPKCAEKFGLPWQRKGKPELAPMPVSA